MSTVYVETSIPSFYYETRQEPEMVARRDWTRKWWDNHRYEYKLVTSEGVIAELEEGDYPSKHNTVALMEGIEKLELEEEIAEIIDTYIEHIRILNTRLGLYVPALVTPIELGGNTIYE